MTSHRARIASAAFFTLSLAPAIGATTGAANPGSEAPADCGQATTQLQLTACADRDFEAAQADQAAVYRALSAGLDAPQRTLLSAAQTAWLQHRTTACGFEASGVRGGSAEAMVRLQCQSRMTRDRTKELRRHLDCPEGDLSCVRPSR